MGKMAYMPYEPEPQRVELPSRGVPYGSDGVIWIRPITAREEKLIASATPQTYMDAIDEVLGRCIKEPQIDLQELTEGDRSFILYWLRINSYFPQYRVDLDCPKCDGAFKAVIDLSELPIKVLPEGVKEPFEVKIAGKTVGLRFLRGKDERTLARLELKLARAKGDTSDRYIYRYALMIKTIEGTEVSFADAKSFVESLIGRDMARLRGAISRMSHGVVFEKEMKCPLCSKNSTFRIPLTAEFFLPDEPYDGEDHGEALPDSKAFEDSLFGGGDDGSEREGVAHRKGDL